MAAEKRALRCPKPSHRGKTIAATRGTRGCFGDPLSFPRTVVIGKLSLGPRSNVSRAVRVPRGTGDCGGANRWVRIGYPDLAHGLESFRNLVSVGLLSCLLHWLRNERQH